MKIMNEQNKTTGDNSKEFYDFVYSTWGQQAMSDHQDGKSPTTRNKALAELAALEDCADYEAGHAEADRVLCRLLITLGYQDVVAAWGKVGKWYA